MRSLASVSLLALATACTDFATPSVLEKPTILAVTAEPPVVTAGGSALLDTIVVDRNGVLVDLTFTYHLIETYSGVAPLGRIEKDATGVHYIAPAEVPTLPGNAPPLDTVEVTVVGGADVQLTARKVMPIGPANTRNPSITRLGIGEIDAVAAAITVRRGETRSLEVVTDPTPGENARFAWYTVAGTIERYQSNPTTLAIDDTAASGWLFVVVRDGQGGVAWRGIQLSVE